MIGRVEALSRRLREEVTAAFDAACAIDEPAGTSEPWRAVCARWEVVPIDEAERAQVRAALRPLRGAPVGELAAVVEAIVRSVRVEARRMNLFDAPADAEAAHEKLLRLVGRVEAELITAYRGEVLPKRGGMFAHVMRHHDGGASAREGASAHSLRCRTCGAPRLKKDDFQCAFCDGRMV